MSDSKRKLACVLDKHRSSVECDNVLFALAEINLAVEYMSFSAHADAKGIMQVISELVALIEILITPIKLIRDVQPRNVMFVHGEAVKMQFLRGKVEKVRFLQNRGKVKVLGIQPASFHAR